MDFYMFLQGLGRSHLLGWGFRCVGLQGFGFRVPGFRQVGYRASGSWVLRGFSLNCGKKCVQTTHQYPQVQAAYEGGVTPSDLQQDCICDCWYSEFT